MVKYSVSIRCVENCSGLLPIAQIDVSPTTLVPPSSSTTTSTTFPSSPAKETNTPRNPSSIPPEAGVTASMAASSTNPVDVVIPWSGDAVGDNSGVNRDDGILKYTIRSVLLNMSWVRRIYVFADPMSHIPSFMRKWSTPAENTRPPPWIEFGARGFEFDPNRVLLVDRCRVIIGNTTTWSADLWLEQLGLKAVKTKVGNVVDEAIMPCRVVVDGAMMCRCY